LRIADYWGIADYCRLPIECRDEPQSAIVGNRQSSIVNQFANLQSAISNARI
jgi:hypothetical protein